MNRLIVFIILILLFLSFTAYVYTLGTEGPNVRMSDESIRGKLLFQKHNCTACHQIYGLGGYLGPDLTTEISQPGKGEAYAAALLKNGSVRMPNFHLSETEIKELVEFLKYVDATAITYKNKGTSPIMNQ
ncbi:MAG: cytochrome c [Bacteroidota bacterium]